MFRTHTPRSFLSLFVMFTMLLFAAPLGTRAQSKEDKKKDKKEEQAQAKAAKQERKYQDIKKFSQDLYVKDTDFHNIVDEAYRHKQREHSTYAYQMNMRSSYAFAAATQEDRAKNKLHDENTLYDNPLAQDYVNRVGQSLVPNDSPNLYAFRIILNPVPESRAFSTGTVYVSSGLLAQIDNEAQLAYVLGHEIAHVEKNHWFEDVLVQHGLEEYTKRKENQRAIIGGLASIGLSMVGASSGSYNTFAYTSLVSSLVPSILKLTIPNAVVSWDKNQEDEADQTGLQLMLARNYDPREVPKFYANLQRNTTRDPRSRLGFIADTVRLAERATQVTLFLSNGSIAASDKAYSVGASTVNSMATAQDTKEKTAADQRKQPDAGKGLDPGRDSEARGAKAAAAIGGKYADEVRRKLDAGELIGSTSEFEAVMAEIKRDNGIRALYYDMFLMARNNLEESLRIRSNDPLAHLYFGKVLKLTARTPADKSRALASFVKAIELDRRYVLPEARLHRALALIENKDPALQREIVANLKDYVTLYQRENAGQLPPNMDVIYDYMQESGELSWSVPPAMNVSTKNIEPLGTANGNNGARAPVLAASVENIPAPKQTDAMQPTQPNNKPANGARKRP